jgi:hypothetical protein
MPLRGISPVLVLENVLPAKSSYIKNKQYVYYVNRYMFFLGTYPLNL